MSTCIDCNLYSKKYIKKAYYAYNVWYLFNLIKKLKNNKLKNKM